jgi:glutamate-1-semialdehyde aminotransferase
MFGHSPAPVVEAVKKQLSKGITMMLPTADCIAVGEELSKRFGLPYWQIAMSATDANRNAIRLARQVTKRPYILVFNGCYHGTVDETLVNIKGGKVMPRVSTLLQWISYWIFYRRYNGKGSSEQGFQGFRSGTLETLALTSLYHCICDSISNTIPDI